MERTKMPRIKRAAQFAPFDALKGLHDALERKRQEHIDKQKQEFVGETELKTQTNVTSCSTNNEE